MKLSKIYVLSAEDNQIEMAFTNESDRNEMALAIFQENFYAFAMRMLNWYGEVNYQAAWTIQNEDIWTYESIFVEG